MVQMLEVEKSVMIALLPTIADWCRLELPHMTLVYAGEIPDLKPTDHNEMAKMALSIAMICGPITLHVFTTDVFGDGQDKVDVLRLKTTPELLAMRQMVERWNASEHPFNPHVTVGPVGSITDLIPAAIRFDRIMVAWGDDQLVYKLVGG